jgi:hypothetical protein
MLVKQTYEEARDLASRGDALSLAKAIILLDLSVELALGVVIMDFVVSKSPKLKPGRKDMGWGELWGIADEAVKRLGHQSPPNYTQLLSLHEVRNLAQHNGSIPTQAEIERYLEPAEDTLCNIFSVVYGLDFKNFRLWDLIPNESLRQLLRESEFALEKGHPDVCIIGCNLAHKLIIRAIRNDTKLRRFRIPSGSARGASSSISVPSGLPYEAASKLKRLAESADRTLKASISQFRREILEEIDFLEDEVVTIGLGMPLMDTRRFVKIGSEVTTGPFYEDGTFDTFNRFENKDDEELKRGARFMLNYLSRLVRLVGESDPEVLGGINLQIPLSGQGVWKKVDGESA